MPGSFGAADLGLDPYPEINLQFAPPAPGPDKFTLANLDAENQISEWTAHLTGALQHGTAVEVFDFRRSNRSFTCTDLRGLSTPRRRIRFSAEWPNMESLFFWPTGNDAAATHDIIWRPPLVLPSLIAGPIAARLLSLWADAWADGQRTDPRWFFCSAASRLRRADIVHWHIMRYGMPSNDPDEPAVLLPGCSWCGKPGNSFCDGILEFECGAPLCNDCERLWGPCRRCLLWVGLPRHHRVAQEYLNRMSALTDNFQGLSVRTFFTEPNDNTTPQL
jgi:hypothetical protein